MSKIFEIIQRMLQQGSREQLATTEPCWDLVPIWPPDVFAVVGTLLERSSGYRQVIEPPSPDNPHSSGQGLIDRKIQQKLLEAGRCWAWNMFGEPQPDVIAQINKFDPELAAVVQKNDTTIIDDCWHQLVHVHAEDSVASSNSLETQAWWLPALSLLIAADVASAGLGFRVAPTIRNGLPTKVQYALLRNLQKAQEEARESKSKFDRGISTLTTEQINQSMVAVLPKTRTSSLGCTIRNLTHNLALLPPISQVEARWYVPGSRPPAAVSRDHATEESKPLNLLLIPFPYRINPSSFHVQKSSDTDEWGFFHVQQDWLHFKRKSTSISHLVTFVLNLIDTAVAEMGEIHGVVFPEYSLNAETFTAIALALKKHATDTGFEFIVAGTSEEPISDKAVSRHGNYAVFSSVERGGEGEWGIRVKTQSAS